MTSKEMTKVKQYQMTVVCEDKMVFPIDPKTGEPLRTTCYDVSPWINPANGECISYQQYLDRRNDRSDPWCSFAKLA
jgi:hypothetical protein